MSRGQDNQSFDFESVNLGATPNLNQQANGGSYFILDTPPAAVEIQLLRNNSIIGRIKGCTRGLKLHIPGGFDQWQAQMTSKAAGVIYVGVSDMDVDINGITGTIQAVVQGGSGMQDSADVTTAAGPGNKVALIAANAARRTLLVRSHQTNNAAGVRIGADATVAVDHGQELYPGESANLDTQAAVSVWNLTNGDKFNITEIIA